MFGHIFFHNEFKHEHYLHIHMTKLHNEIQELRDIAQECETTLRKHLPRGLYVSRDKVRLEVFNDDTQISIDCQEKRAIIMYQKEEVKEITYDNHSAQDIAMIITQHVLRRVL